MTKDLAFDVEIEINVKVLPRQYPYEMGDKIIWEGIQSEINFVGKRLGIGFEKYLEDLTEELVNIRFK